MMAFLICWKEVELAELNFRFRSKVQHWHHIKKETIFSLNFEKKLFGGYPFYQ
jgi:hypothetical protein